jgi:uncharacterized Zn-finger protein
VTVGGLSGGDLDGDLTMAEEYRQPNAQTEYDVMPEDLPLCFPMPQMSLRNSHPRLYLPIEETGWAKCPYCAAEFTLKR